MVAICVNEGNFSHAACPSGEILVFKMNKEIYSNLILNIFNSKPKKHTNYKKRNKKNTRIDFDF